MYRLSQTMKLPIQTCRSDMDMEIEHCVVEYLRQRLSRGQAVDAETTLLASGLLDSLALTDLVAFIEHTFAMTVPDTDLEPDNFRTPRAVAALIARLQGPT